MISRRSLPSVLFLLLYLALILAAEAQGVNQIWIQRYAGQANRQDIPRSMVVTATGDVVVGGRTELSTGDLDLFVIKYSGATGAILWERRYGGPGQNWDSADYLALDSAGDVYVCGSSIGNNTGYDYYTAKYSGETGAILWERRYTGQTTFLLDSP